MNLVVVIKMAAFICAAPLAQNPGACMQQDLLAGPGVPMSVRYTKNEFVGIVNVQQYIAGLATRPRPGELLIVRAIPTVVPKDVGDQLDQALVDGSGKIGEGHASTISPR